MKATISAKLERNLSRVQNLVKLYETNLAGQGQGRRGHAVEAFGDNVLNQL
jgi:hypothetical protein